MENSHNIGTVEVIPEEIVAAADEAVSDLVPLKSKDRYETEYNSLETWMKDKQVNIVNETVLLAYFSEKSKIYLCSSLWSKYSAVKKMLLIKKNVDIGSYHKLISFLKKNYIGYEPKKTMVLSKENVIKFVVEADDHTYLMIKVAVVFSIFGACRREELANMSIDDIEDRGSVLVITIPKTKTNKKRVFTVINDDKISGLVVYRKYTVLRPERVNHRRFFLQYKNNTCNIQPVGKNTFGSIPKTIAKYLQLPNPEKYTGHAFRRTSATLLTDSGADITCVKRRGRWKSTSVAEGYLEDVIGSKNKVARLISGMEGEPDTSPAATSAFGGVKENRWTVNQIEALIDQYKKYPVLYDTNHEEYSNAELKSGCLANIVEALQTVRLRVTDEDVTSQWDNLMIKYVEATRVQQAQNQEPEFRYLNKLHFLQEHTGSTEIKLEDCSTIEYDETKLYDPHTTTELREWRDGTDSLPSSFEIKEEIEGSPPSKKHKDEDSESLESGTSPEDEYDIFGKFVASQLRKIPDDEVRQDIIFEVHKLLYKGLKKK